VRMTITITCTYHIATSLAVVLVGKYSELNHAYHAVIDFRVYNPTDVCVYMGAFLVSHFPSFCAIEQQFLVNTKAGISQMPSVHTFYVSRSIFIHVYTHHSCIKSTYIESGCRAKFTKTRSSFVTFP
jgi:hypothetical protein